MKKNYILVLLLLTTVFVFSQNKEKIKGSKIVTTIQKEIGDFTALEVEDKIEIYLEKGFKNEIKIEADENLQEFIVFDLKDKTLRIYTSKEAINYKKLIVRVQYTSDLKTVVSKNEAIINSIEAIQLDDITFSTLDYSKLFLNVNSKKFTLKCNDKSKVELNLKAENTKIELSKNAQLKALVSAVDATIDLYQKATATLEGDATNAVVRLDNNAAFTGNKFNIKNADLTAESYTYCSLFAETSLIVDATDKSEIQLFGMPKIEMRKFTGEAKLIKKIKIN